MYFFVMCKYLWGETHNLVVIVLSAIFFNVYILIIHFTPYSSDMMKKFHKFYLHKNAKNQRSICKMVTISEVREHR